MIIVLLEVNGHLMVITEKNILSSKLDEKIEEFTTENKQKGQIIYGPLQIEIEENKFKKWGEYKFICFFAESEFKTVISSIEPYKEQTK